MRYEFLFHHTQRNRKREIRTIFLSNHVNVTALYWMEATLHIQTSRATFLSITFGRRLYTDTQNRYNI